MVGKVEWTKSLVHISAADDCYSKRVLLPISTRDGEGDLTQACGTAYLEGAPASSDRAARGCYEPVTIGQPILLYPTPVLAALVAV